MSLLGAAEHRKKREALSEEQGAALSHHPITLVLSSGQGRKGGREKGRKEGQRKEGGREKGK